MVSEGLDAHVKTEVVCAKLSPDNNYNNNNNETAIINAKFKKNFLIFAVLVVWVNLCIYTHVLYYCFFFHLLQCKVESYDNVFMMWCVLLMIKMILVKT